MKHLRIKQFGLGWVVVVLVVAGCSESSAPPPPLTVEQFPSVMEKAFAKAKPEIRNMVNEVVSAVQTNGFAAANTGLQGLSAVPGLTKEQSSAVGRGMLLVNSLLQSAATQGDQNAAATLDFQRRTK